MADHYSAYVHLDGCGELINQSVQVDDSDPAVVVVTVVAYKPGA
jgi:hypothetical protein